MANDSLSEEHKKKISDSNKGKHSLKIWVTDGTNSLKILPEEFEEYAQKGYGRGRTVTKPPWNKGLTKDDPRVMSYINNRKK